MDIQPHLLRNYTESNTIFLNRKVWISKLPQSRYS